VHLEVPTAWLTIRRAWCPPTTRSFREQLTGWVIAECEDLDGAVRLATTIPAAWYGSVEVRPAGQTLA
jgi:hypothetical protein